MKILFFMFASLFPLFLHNYSFRLMIPEVSELSIFLVNH